MCSSLEQLRALHLELELAAVLVLQRALERVTSRSPSLGAVSDRSAASRSAGREQLVEPVALDLVDLVAEQTLDRRALVRDDAALRRAR